MSGCMGDASGVVWRGKEKREYWKGRRGCVRRVVGSWWWLVDSERERW